MKIHRRARRLFEVRSSPIHGKGGFATRPIPRGLRVVEYTGQRIGHAEADARYDDVHMRHHHTFLFKVDGETVIDAARDGNVSRYLNHSCDPNCKVVIEGGRVFIEAKSDIPVGAELTYDYGIAREGTDDERSAERYACRCGSRRCRGTILSPRAAPQQRRRQR